MLSHVLIAVIPFNNNLYTQILMEYLERRFIVPDAVVQIYLIIMKQLAIQQ